LVRFAHTISLPHPLPLLKIITTGLLYFIKSINYIDNISPPLSPLFTLTLLQIPPPHRACFTILSLIFESIFIFSKGFLDGISAVNTLYFSQINSLYYVFPYPYYLTAFRAFLYAIFLHRYNVV
jgi:hypothetical protein